MVIFLHKSCMQKYHHQSGKAASGKLIWNRIKSLYLHFHIISIFIIFHFHPSYLHSSTLALSSPSSLGLYFNHPSFLHLHLILSIIFIFLLQSSLALSILPMPWCSSYLSFSSLHLHFIGKGLSSHVASIQRHQQLSAASECFKTSHSDQNKNSKSAILLLDLFIFLINLTITPVVHIPYTNRFDKSHTGDEIAA